jgi:hypothetical protein
LYVDFNRYTVNNAGFVSQLKAIENMREGRMAKLYLEWSEPWWNHGEGFLNFAWSREVQETILQLPQCRLFLVPEKKKCKKSEGLTFQA